MSKPAHRSNLAILAITALLTLAVGACAPDQETGNGSLTAEQDGGVSKAIGSGSLDARRRKCVAGLPCTANPNQCTSGVTSCAAGAQTCVDGVIKANGTACNDGNACSFNDVCINGVCGGIPYACTPTSCESSAVCDGSGACITTPKPDGSPCSDPNADCCIVGGNPSCSHGVCGFPVCCNTAQCCSL